MANVDYRQGDYRVVAERLRPAAERLVQTVGIGSDDLVVDVAAGSGNVSRLCAERGARVVAVDLVPEQLRLGRAATDQAIAWVAGDAHALPVASGVATAALSTFGLIYASRPDVAVAELARVCRPGSRIGLTCWPKVGYQATASKLLAELAGIRAEGHDHIATWGDDEQIRERLSPVADEIEVERHELASTMPSVDAWWERASTAAPPLVSARQRLDDDAWSELGRRSRELAQRFGEQTADGFVLRDAYLLVRARTR